MEADERVSDVLGALYREYEPCYQCVVLNVSNNCCMLTCSRLSVKMKNVLTLLR